jgi:hypothetical protein
MKAGIRFFEQQVVDPRFWKQFQQLGGTPAFFSTQIELL